jgi:YidC/Oxa1 family membrane protein insertase
MPILANVIQDAFSPLISAFEAVMVFLHDNIVVGSWGLAIVGLTVLVRAVLVPLTFKQLKSMQEMQRLAPQINALKEKYKDDKQRQQQEIMKFYQAHKINPLASCLPLVLQLPVFISLFYMLRTDLKLDICGAQLRAHFSKQLGHAIATNSQIPSDKLSKITCSQVPGAHHAARFLFLPDITSKATGAALIALIVLYVGSQLASTLVATATADRNQRRLMLVLPLVFVAILYRYPAGLLVYWITSNLWTIAQQFIVRRRMGAPGAASGTGPGGTSPNGKADDGAGRSSRPALAGVGAGAADRQAAPPRPPRKKKKRSGRRR